MERERERVVTICVGERERDVVRDIDLWMSYL